MRMLSENRNLNSSDLDRISPENVDKPAVSPADATDQEVREVLPAIMAPGIQAAINGRNSTPLGDPMTTQLPDINITPTSEMETKTGAKKKKEKREGEKKSKKKKTDR